MLKGKAKEVRSVIEDLATISTNLYNKFGSKSYEERTKLYDIRNMIYEWEKEIEKVNEIYNNRV